MSNNVDIYFKAHVGDVSKGIGKVRTEMDGLTKKTKEHGSAFREWGEEQKSAIGKMVAGFFAVEAAIEVVRGGMEKYAEISDESIKTGLSPEFLQDLSDAAEVSGANLDEVANASVKLSKAIDFGKETDLSTEALQALGMSLDDLQKMTPDEQFHRVSEAIMGIEDPSQRAAAAVAIFGRAGADLIPTFKALNEQKGASIRLDAEQIARIKEMDDGFIRLKQRIVSGAALILSDVKPALDWINKAIQSIGAAIGAEIARAEALLQAFGRAFELVKHGDVKGAWNQFKEDFSQDNSDFATTMADSFLEIWKPKPEQKPESNSESGTPTTGAPSESTPPPSPTATSPGATSPTPKKTTDFIGMVNAYQRLDIDRQIAEVREKSASLDYSQQQKINMLVAQRKRLEEQRAQTSTEQGKAQLDLQIARKQAEIDAAQREQRMSLPADQALKDYQNNSQNYDAGQLLNPGQLRALERRAAIEKQRADRQKNALGSAPKTPEKSEAEKLREKMFGDKDAMKKAATKVSPASDKAKDKGKEPKRTTDDLYDILDKRLPSKTAK